MFHRLKRKTLFVIPLALLLLSLCMGAVVSHSASAATTLGQAAAASGRVIGAAIYAQNLGNNTYTNILQTQFSGLTPANEMKWDATEPSQGNFNFGSADTIVNFAQSHNMKVRGHTLVWHSQLPGWVNNVPSSQVLSVMNNHITTEMTHFKGKIWYWDVVNEAFNEDGTRGSDVFQNVIGNSYIEDAFRTARAADPNAKLCYNDYNLEDMNYAKSRGVYAMVQDFKSRGVPIDCVGFQAHLIVGQVPTDLQATLQKFAALGVDVQLTELDIRMPTPASSANLAQQATDYANVAKACLAVSRCTDMTTWGIGEPDSWIPGTFPGQGQGLLYDQNYQPKAAYTSFLNALLAGGATPPPTATPTQGITPTPTTAVTPTPTTAVTPTPTTAVTPTPTTAVTPTPTPISNASCKVSYSVNQWPGGFTANLVITNTGSSPINGWTLQFTFPNNQQVTQGWSGVYSQSGGNVTVTNASYNGSIPPGSSVNPGFNGSWTGANSSPSAFTLNGAACSGA